VVGQDGILRTDCQSVQPGAARPNLPGKDEGQASDLSA
jgi:hypothetical protein